MNAKEVLQSVIDDARNKLYDIEREENLAVNRVMVGKFFKVRNSFSCPAPDEYWYVYTAVTGLTESGDPHGWQFQTDTDGKVIIEPIDWVSGSAIVISSAEFMKAYKKVLKELERYAA